MRLSWHHIHLIENEWATQRQDRTAHLHRLSINCILMELASLYSTVSCWIFLKLLSWSNLKCKFTPGVQKHTVAPGPHGVTMWHGTSAISCCFHVNAGKKTSKNKLLTALAKKMSDGTTRAKIIIKIQRRGTFNYIFNWIFTAVQESPINRFKWDNSKIYLHISADESLK